MKICIDTRGAKLYSGTGIGTYTARLLENIIKIDFKNEYMFFWPNEGYDFLTCKDNIEVTLFGERNKRFWDEFYLPQNISKGKYDVFHLPQNGLGMPKVKHCNYIITLHDLIPYSMPETCSKSYLERFLSEMPGIVKNSDKIITVSEYSKKDILKYFDINPDKVEVIHLAADSMFKPIDKQEARLFIEKTYGISDQFILYLGGFSERKNVKGLIAAFEKIINKLPSPHKLVILGAPNDNHDDLRKFISSLGVEEKVIFTGFVPYGHLPMFYNSTSLFVYPSYYEGFGLPPLEAMSCGTPTITSNVTSIPEIVGDGAIIIEPDDIESLSAKMLEVLCDTQLQSVMREKALSRSSNFNWECTARKTIEIYEQYGI